MVQTAVQPTDPCFYLTQTPEPLVVVTVIVMVFRTKKKIKMQMLSYLM